MSALSADAVRQVSFYPMDTSRDNSDGAELWRMLLAEAELAVAMMALARISRNPETMRRNRKNARKAYEAAMKLVLLTPMSDAQQLGIWNGLAPVREWLEYRLKR
jgi:hypothetical protein